MWTLQFEKDASKDFEKLPQMVQKRIWSFFLKRILTQPDPHILGKSLSGSFKGLWRYRVGDYRVICQIQKTTVTVLVLAVGHRSTVYKGKNPILVNF